MTILGCFRYCARYVEPLRNFLGKQKSYLLLEQSIETSVNQDSLRFVHITSVLWKKKNILTDAVPVPVKASDVKVLLIDETGNNLGISSKRLAQDKADAMGLRMVNVKDFPELEKAIGRTSVHPIYKLIKGEDLHILQLGEREAARHLKRISSKVLQLTSTAADHDVDTKIKAAKNWLQKGDNVRVLILGRMDKQARMGELHQIVLSRLKAFAKPNIPDLSKSDTKIGFTLLALEQENQPEDTELPPVHSKTEDHSAPLYEAQKEFVDAENSVQIRTMDSDTRPLS